MFPNVRDYEKRRRFTIDKRVRPVLPPQIYRPAASTKANRIALVRPSSHHEKGKLANSRLTTTIRRYTGYLPFKAICCQDLHFLQWLIGETFARYHGTDFSPLGRPRLDIERFL